MKTGFRSIVVGLFLATVSSGFGAIEKQESAPVLPAQPAISATSAGIVSQKATLSANELAKYRQLQQQAEDKTRDQAAGEGMDKTTMVIIGVLVVVVVVAAAGGGGGGGSGY